MQESTKLPKAIAEGILKVQSEVNNVVSDSSNPAFKSHYPSLKAVRNLLRPLWTKHGLAVIQNRILGGDGLEVCRTIVSSGGESWVSDSPLHFSTNGRQNQMQAVQSAMTYCARQELLSIFQPGIADEEDDDAANSGLPQGNVRQFPIQEQPKRSKKEEALDNLRVELLAKRWNKDHTKQMTEYLFQKKNPQNLSVEEIEEFMGVLTFGDFPSQIIFMMENAEQKE